MSRIEDIKARVAAATPGPWEWDGRQWLILGPSEDRDGISEAVVSSHMPDYDSHALRIAAPDAAFIAHARADIPDLLRVVEAARLVKAQCDDMCPSWYDEPCDCGMDALRSALADLDR